MPKTKYPAPLAPTKPIVPYNHFGVCRGGGPPPLGSGPGQEQPLWCAGGRQQVPLGLGGRVRNRFDSGSAAVGGGAVRLPAAEGCAIGGFGGMPGALSSRIRFAYSG